MDAPGKQGDEHEFQRLFIHYRRKRPHYDRHCKRLFDSAEAENVEAEAVPDKITQPRTVSVPPNDIRHGSLCYDRDNDKEDLKIVVRNGCHELVEPEKAEVSAAVPPLAEPAVLRYGVHISPRIFHQVSREILVPPSAYKRVKGSHKNNIYFSLLSLLRQQKAENDHGSHNKIIYFNAHASSPFYVSTPR